ncbi:hypothetical protein MHI37_14080 [Paenibacillus sp. FSL H8-0548]|uniref:DUF6906 family protein n=1 Tax=Paenibacillus sp. FSL H8-0548 TaxID=1920422 RepID=UPI0015C35948|nr:hypothetical protein [Paenibacillus sp. FSL H8-0548]
MKNGKVPTRKQKNAISSVKLTPANWLVFKVEPNRLHIVHRISEKTRVIHA